MRVMCFAFCLLHSSSGSFRIDEVVATKLTFRHHDSTTPQAHLDTLRAYLLEYSSQKVPEWGQAHLGILLAYLLEHSS